MWHPLHVCVHMRSVATGTLCSQHRAPRLPFRLCASVAQAARRANQWAARGDVDEQTNGQPGDPAPSDSCTSRASGAVASVHEIFRCGLSSESRKAKYNYQQVPGDSSNLSQMDLPTPRCGLPTRCRRPHRYSGDHERTSIACLHLCLHQEAMYTHFHAECSTLQFLCVSGLHRVQHAHFLTLDVNACEYMYNNPNYCIMEKYSCTYTNAITNAYTCTW